MTEYINPFSKQAQLSRSPGNRKKQSNKEKGESAEKEVQAHFQATSKKKIKRNAQNGKAWGGASNPDVSAMDGWAIEVKDTERLEIPKWIGKLADRVNLGVDSVEQAGGEVVFP